MLQRPNESATSSDGAADLADENARGIVAPSTVVNIDRDGVGDGDAASDERGGYSKNGPVRHTTAVAGSQGKKSDLGGLEVRHVTLGYDGGDSHFDIPAPTAPLVAAAPTGAVLPVEASARDERPGGEGGDGGGRGNGSVFTVGAVEKPQALDTFGEKQGPFCIKMQSRRVDSMEWGMGWSSDFGSR